MDNTVKEWESWYSCGPSARKATSVVEPEKVSVTAGYCGLMTEQEAYDQFKDGLARHVTKIRSKLLVFSNNKTLKDRLQKYGCIKELDELVRIEHMINSL